MKRVLKPVVQVTTAAGALRRRVRRAAGLPFFAAFGAFFLTAPVPRRRPAAVAAVPLAAVATAVVALLADACGDSSALASAKRSVSMSR
jgi:hypothetical protein